MAVTQKQIAQELGVSRQLVGYALTDTGTISSDMKQRILAAAQEMGYRRNAMAAGVRSGKFGSVALLLSSHPHASTLPLRVLDSVLSVLDEAGVHLIVHRLPMNTLADRQRLPKVLTEWMCDGLLIDVTHQIPTPMVQAIEDSKLPATWLNVPREFDTVRPDDYEAGRQAARHLLNLGHRRICYLDLSHYKSEVQGSGLESPEHYSARDRYAGVRDEVEFAGGEFILKVQSEPYINNDRNDRFAQQCQGVRQLLMDQKPTAIISYDEVDFVPLMVARELGLRVPRDLSFITFGAAPHWFMGQYVTTMVIPEREMGRQLAESLLTKIASPASQFPSIVLPFRLEPGETCAPVGKH